MVGTDAVVSVMEQEGVITARLDQEKIEGLIPHKKAALLIRRAIVTMSRMGQPCVIAEAFFNHDGLKSLHEGHFPDEPVLMGVLPQEAIQQALALLATYQARASGKSRGSKRSAILLGVTDVSWELKALPTDSITVEAYLDSSKRASVEGSGLARSDQGVICSVGGIHGMWRLRKRDEIGG